MNSDVLTTDRPSDTTTDTRQVLMRRAGAVLLAVTGVLHLFLVPEYLEEAHTIGVLFVIGGIAALLLAAWLWIADHEVAWWAAMLIALGMVVGFLLSRTVGLLGFQEAEWEGSGILSIVLELGVVATYAASRLRR